MAKVKVSQEVADALDYVTRNFSNEAIIDAHVRCPNGWHMDENKALKGLDLDVLCQALYNGYTAEKTPDEKVLEYFNVYRNKILDGTATPTEELVAQAIETTCILLNAKIKGVNC
ncbi:hypothetical protein [Lysinibacillus sp. FSL L8-0126]|uniref:hypothetical protein n=1 Tax=Lysinibacillus sp. FSL L8-0126 TaxID=2921515 RepID=UPI00315B0F1F